MKKKDPTSHRIIEKRRRDRMNNCLTDLSRLIPAHYMKKGRGRIEKTEIIEMAIKYLKDLIEATNVQHQALQHQSLSNVASNSSGSEIGNSSSSSGSSIGSNCFSSSSDSGRSSSSSSISSTSSSGSERNSTSMSMNFNHSIVDCFNTNANGENNSTSRNQVVIWYKKALLVRSISRSPPRR